MKETINRVRNTNKYLTVLALFSRIAVEYGYPAQLQCVAIQIIQINEQLYYIHLQVLRDIYRSIIGGHQLVALNTLWKILLA